MRTPRILIGILIAISASAATLTIQRMVVPSPALAQEGSSTLGGYVLYATHRRDTDKNESFIFFNSQTGDIWVYEDAKVKEHYRLSTIGQDLEKLN